MILRFGPTNANEQEALRQCRASRFPAILSHASRLIRTERNDRNRRPLPIGAAPHRFHGAQRLESRTKRPLGTPFAVYHFHNSKLAMINVGTASLEIDVVRDKVVTGLGELNGNIRSLKRYLLPFEQIVIPRHTDFRSAFLCSERA